MFKHLLLTRFNVFYQTKIQERGYDPDVWLVERLDIFLKFCFPSILNQSEKNFIWFFYIDSKTPDPVRLKLEEAFQPFPFIRLISHEYDDFAIYKYLQEDIDLYLGKDFDFLISSRVDTDDMLHRDYMASIQGFFERQKYKALNFNKGLVYDSLSGVTSTMVHRYNAFISLIEEKTEKGFFTVFHKSHTDYRYDPDKIEIKIKKSMWCVTIHGFNDSTSFYGRVNKAKLPDMEAFYGFQNQKTPSFRDIMAFSIRSYNRTLKKIKVKLQGLARGI